MGRFVGAVPLPLLNSLMHADPELAFSFDKQGKKRRTMQSMRVQATEKIPEIGHRSFQGRHAPKIYPL